MAKLSTEERKKLPASDFAGPGRSFPVNDKAHAANAKARVANKSPALKAKVDAKADKVLKPAGPIDPATLSSMTGSLKNVGR